MGIEFAKAFHEEMMRKYGLLAALLLAGCSGESSGNPGPVACDAAPWCDGAVRAFCSNGTEMREPCGIGRTCASGACVAQACGTDYDPHCEGSVALRCVAGRVQTETCGGSCSGGRCAGHCGEDFKAYCNETGEAVSCVGGRVRTDVCTDGRVCAGGECVNLAPECGNGIPESGEACDDGDQNGEYGYCRNGCGSVSRCGDAQADAPWEACDDGDDNGQYGRCRADCSGVARCGDGIPDAGHEACDDGANNGRQGYCAADCQYVAGCGDGEVREGESCDPPSTGWLRTCANDCTTPKALFPEYPVPGNVSTEPGECTDLWQKYLLYRERFVGNAARHIPGFVSWGTEAGQSLPASYRDPDMNCATAWKYHHDGVDCAFADLPDAQGAYAWGDTSLWLGIMMHWLATEYAVYRIYGIDTAETERYIALALRAFDRIDRVAETHFGMEGKLDGFFIRDDIPRDFYRDGAGYRFARTDGANLGYECAASDSTCEFHSGGDAHEMIKGGTFVSQDQMTGLFEGLGMLARLVDADAEFDGMRLQHAAKSAIDRMARYLRDNHWMIGIQTPEGWLQVPETWGGYVQMLSSLFAESADAICGTEFGQETYHDDATAQIKLVISGIVSTAWLLWESENNYNRNLVLRLLNFTHFWNDDKFQNTSLEAGREIWSLTHALFWDVPLPDDYPLWRMHSILASAPCTGTCRGKSCPAEVPGWMGESYFISPNDRVGYVHNEGDYNGLDYLIAHNTYLLAYVQKTGRGYAQDISGATGTKHQLRDYILGQPLATEYKVSENGADMGLRFCGRTFADWIRDNALGLVDIYTGTSRWACDLDGTCRIASDSAPYSHRNAVVIGTDGADTVTVPTGFHHCIATLGGNDVITAAAGMHVIEAGDGDDAIRTDGPHVTIYAGDGNDAIYPGNGYHLIDAGPGNDAVSGTSAGTYLIHGGSGNDHIQAGAGANHIHGGPGNDIIEAAHGSNDIWTEDGNDKIRVGNGNNIIRIGAGAAFAIVGNGDNSIQTEESPRDDVRICFGSGKNSIYAGWSSRSLCSADVQNSDIHDNSCRAVLTSEDCSAAAWNAAFGE